MKRRIIWKTAPTEKKRYNFSNNKNFYFRSKCKIILNNKLNYLKKEILLNKNLQVLQWIHTRSYILIISITKKIIFSIIHNPSISIRIKTYRPMITIMAHRAPRDEDSNLYYSNKIMKAEVSNACNQRPITNNKTYQPNKGWLYKNRK